MEMRILGGGDVCRDYGRLGLWAVCTGGGFCECECICAPPSPVIAMPLSKLQRARYRINLVPRGGGGDSAAPRTPTTLPPPKGPLANS